jgi:hypothetical protein
MKSLIIASDPRHDLSQHSTRRAPEINLMGESPFGVLEGKGLPPCNIYNRATRLLIFHTFLPFVLLLFLFLFPLLFKFIFLFLLLFRGYFSFCLIFFLRLLYFLPFISLYISLFPSVHILFRLLLSAFLCVC